MKFTLTTSFENGECKYVINGAFNVYCDEKGKITQQIDLLNEQQLNNALTNALNPNGCQ